MLGYVPKNDEKKNSVHKGLISANTLLRDAATTSLSLGDETLATKVESSGYI